MEHNKFTVLDPENLIDLIRDDDAAKTLYQIICEHDCEKIVCCQVACRSSAEGEYKTIGILVRRKNGAYHALLLRLLEKQEDMEKYQRFPAPMCFEFEDEKGNLQACAPRIQVLVYFLLSDSLPERKTVYRFGFPTGKDDIEDIYPEIPTIIITTEGPGDGSELSELTRYLRDPDPNHQKFGAIGRRTERIRLFSFRKW